MRKDRLAPTPANASKNVRLQLKKNAAILLVIGILRGFDAYSEEVVSKPLAEPSKAEGKTLFTELSPERTGVQTTNRYDDPRMWGSLFSEHTVGAIGTGVAIGDFDGDSRPDIYVVSKVESGRLFRNLGDWRFEDVTESAGLLDDSGVWKQGAAFADVDNDGDLDLYLCRFDAPNQLFINQGNGTFKEEAKARGLDAVSASGGAAFADYDRDGWLDMYLQTNIRSALESIDGEPDRLYRNNGDGTYTEVTEAAGISSLPTQGHSAIWWDQNNDGWLDLYVANDFARPDFLYRNNGDGTFTNVIDEALPHTPFSSMGSDIGDIDNDGDIDLFVGDMAGFDYEFTQRGLSDSRSRMEEAYNDQSDVAVQIHNNVLFLNTGTGRSLDAAHIAGLEGTDWTWSPRFEDLNCDGRIDFFVTNGMDREHNNLDFIVKKLRAVNVMSRIRVAKSSEVLRQANLAFENRGNLTFEEVGAEWGLDKVGVSFGSALGDLDGDGDLDIVFSNYQEGATVLRNDSQRGKRMVIELRGDVSNHFGIGSKVELRSKTGIQTRRISCARGYLSTSESVAQFALEAADEVVGVRIVWPNGRSQELGALALGQRHIVEEPSWESMSAVESRADNAKPLFEEVSEELGLALLQGEEEAEGTVSQPLLPRRFNRRGPGLAVGDLDGDGIDEIVVGATSLDGAKVLRRVGKTYVEVDTGAMGEAPPINDGPPLIFDANGDGLNDVLLTAGGAALPAEEPEYEPRLWLNQGEGQFVRASSDYLPSLPMSVGAAVAADFNRDGSLDLFLGGRLFPGYYPEACYSVLLMQGAEGFEDVTRSVTPSFEEIGLVTSALASDVDRDGWPDLVVCLEWGGVKCFRNEEGRRFVDVSKEWGFESAGSGLWTSLAAADFNSDGRMDFVVGNQGLNTLYRGSREFPMALFSGSFAKGSDPQLVLAFNEEGVRYPVASRGELAAKIPEVKKRFPSNDAFAGASLKDIFGDEALEEAELYEAGEMSSGVLLSEAAGRYQFVALPRLAQLAPAQGLLASDLNGDGFADILLVQNDYSAIPPHGRFDSGLGLLLLGDGQGTFSSQSISESGWSVSGNAKALVLLDMDGDAWPDALASRNNQVSLAFRNRGTDGNRGVALRLIGRSGNPSGIGAVVRVERDGVADQFFEVRAGGGWASQASASVFLAIPEGTSAKAEVRWPSGTVSEVPLNLDSGYVEVKE